MLKLVKTELTSNYYDTNFHGIDIDARFKLADEKMKTAQSLGQLVGIVAQVLLDLNDSHTAFIPPYNSVRTEYGWRMKPVGADCYVRMVLPGSDAEAKGLRAGDKVLSIDDRPMDRTKVWLAEYLYYTLRPQPTITLMVEKPDKRRERLVINAKVINKTRVRDVADALRRIEAGEEYDRYLHQFHELSEEVLIWKMSQFDLSEAELEDKFRKLKNRKALILDLRGNPGGYVHTLERFTGYFFNSSIKISDLKGRKKNKPSFARSQKEKAFKGQLVVLIDGESSSAAECFAKIVQLEKRGIVIGDRSAGFVMQSRHYPLEVGHYAGLAFGLDITEADVIMPDGKSLEHVGVTPDELLLPTPQDMSEKLDPVLVRAAAMVGITLDPKQAGKLFSSDPRDVP